MALLGVSVDLAGAENMAERLTLIGQAAYEAEVKVEALNIAAFLIAAGKSKSSIKNLRPHVHNGLRDHANFVPDVEGGFWYIPYPPLEELIGQTDVAHTIEQEESGELLIPRFGKSSLPYPAQGGDERL